MDPLSVTASIIAVLQLTSNLTSYIRDVKHATREQRKVAMEASNLNSLLTNLQYRVEDARSGEPWFNQVKLLAVEGGPLNQFKEMLEKMVKQIESSRRRDQIKSALMWTFTRAEVENVLNRMERLKSLIQCALTEDVFTLSQAIHGEVETLAARVDELHIQLQNQACQDLQRRLEQWLGVPDPSTNYRAAIEKRHPKTGSWLVKGSQFNDWKSSECSLMWLHGNAGCGKTVLCTTALEAIFIHHWSKPDTAVGYFYFDFNDFEKQSPRKAIRSLLLQFAQAVPNGLQSLEQMYHRCGNGQQQPPDDMIYSLLLDLMDQVQFKYIVVDALDECTDCDNFLMFVSKLADARLQGLRIMLVSRRELDIEEQLRPRADYSINIESSVVDDDIWIYVQHLLATDANLKAWPKSVQEEISGVIMKKANGMFQWVHCQLQSVRKCVKRSKLREVLSSLPQTLDETYQRILQRLESEGQLPDTIAALRWLCYSNRPLRVAELAEVLAIENGDFSPEQRLRKPADIMVVCSSLVSCDTLNDGGYIRLSHFSVKEYLLSDRSSFHSGFAAKACHQQIAEDCLHYLQYLTEQAPLTEEVVDQHPLAQYSAAHWWKHARNLEVTDNSMVFDLASKLLIMDRVALLSWLQLDNPEDPLSGPNLSLTFSDIAEPLYYATLLGMVALVEEILLQNVDINDKGGRYGNALQAASAAGHEKIVQLLLESGADVNAQGGAFNHALHAASFEGHESVVQMLLEAGADANADGRHFGSALYEASSQGHKEIVQMLLEAGADVDFQGQYHGNSLQAASFGGFEKVVQMLLKAGADVNTQGGYHGNALQAASQKGREKIVQILLEAGADVNVQGGHYGTSLIGASEWGEEKIVQILLEAGADVKGQEGCHALQAASLGGYEKVVQMLLEAEADVNAQGGQYGNALQAASHRGYENVVQILLAAGADVNIQGGHYGTSLIGASDWGHEKVVQMLLKAGADVNLQGQCHGSSLQAASFGGHEKVVQILLEAGADVNAQGGYHGSALQAASFNGHVKVVQILLAAGADVNIQGGHYGTSLIGAADGGHEQVMQILLEAGAAVNAQAGVFNHTLQAASLGGYKKVVEMLLKAGADVNARGGYHGSALQAASFNGHVKVVQILLEAGADVNLEGGCGGSALQAASAYGSEEVVQLLLKAGADVNIQGRKHKSALYGASVYGHDRIVQMLLEAGADVNAEGYYGDPLLGASRWGYEKVVQLLLKAGAEVTGRRGRHALLEAVYEGYERIVQMLLDAGIEVKGLTGSDALGEAIYEGHQRIEQMLRDAGAEEGEWGYTVASLWDEWTTI